MISVSLVDKMGSDLSVVNSARVSFDKRVEKMGLSDEKLIKYLADHKHLTPFRHTAIQVRCKAPIFLARQLGKHQAGLSWNEVSRRYVDSEPEFYVPHEWRERPRTSIKQGSGQVHRDTVYWEDEYAALMKASASLYDRMIKDNVAPEMVRMLLPQSMLTEWYWTGNLLSFAHVYNERIAPNAQEEAQIFAMTLDAVIHSKFPTSWSALTKE